MAYELKPDDMFYDIESLSNIFTCTHYYPSGKHPKLKVFYLWDNKMDIYKNDFPDVYINDNTDSYKTQLIHLMKDRIFQRNPNLPKDTIIEEYDMSNPDNFEKFVEIYGVSECQETVPDNAQKTLYYPVKMTDIFYDANKHGLRFGYNSANYDMTILADLFSEIKQCQTNVNYDEHWDFKKALTMITANQIRNTNDQLFDPRFKGNMPSYLAAKDDGFGMNYGSPSWRIRKSWLLTNRFIDVGKLNEKMSKIALKRILGMLGGQILESENLKGKAEIVSVDDFLELVAYNTSDVVNLYDKVFLHPIYQSNFLNKNQLLSEIPELIYRQDPLGDYCAVKDESIRSYYVRRDRLLSDSTSAKFVELSLCPYEPAISDIEAVSFDYPSKQFCVEHGVEQYNVLEETKDWFTSKFKSGPAYDNFMNVYDFYKNIEGHNFNSSDEFRKLYDDDGNPLVASFTKKFETAKDNEYVKALMTKYNTNLFYVTNEGENTSCMVTFSVGGIHGQEIDKAEYEKDLNAYNKELEKLNFVKAMYNNDPELASNDLRYDAPVIDDVGEPVYYKNGKPKTKKQDTVVYFEDGTNEPLKKFIKNKTKKNPTASWKEPKPVNLFVQATRFGKKLPFKLNKNYVYTSIGKANHEDFTSYYPSLLIRLGTFWNENLGFDRYDEFFTDRKKMKKLAKDPTYSESERAMYNLRQNGKKLILNSASGAGDATFDSNIRVNNKTMSMRIIGQLFAWTIGQAQTYAGARVPSTNTDGLYTMDIDEETNNKILNDIVGRMYIDIEPEIIDKFVSKDSNNRLDFVEDEIADAKGGSLSSHNGPEPDKNLAHPAICDKLLADYLANYDDAPNLPFNRQFVENNFAKIISRLSTDKENPEKSRITLLRYLQNIVASSDGTQRYVYGIDAQNTLHFLQNYNRAFLVSKNERNAGEYKLAKISNRIPPVMKLKVATTDEKKDEHESNGNIAAEKVLNHHGININATMLKAKNIKLTGMDNEQDFVIFNGDLSYMTDEEFNCLLHDIDFDSYVSLVESSFVDNWQNKIAKS